jgi:hypothetical protein
MRRKIFKAFFSYAHQDARTDATLIPAFIKELENQSAQAGDG